MTTMKRLLFIGTLLAMVLSACAPAVVKPPEVQSTPKLANTPMPSSPTTGVATTQPSMAPATKQPAPTLAPVDPSRVYLPPFAEYKEPRVSLPAKTAADYSLPVKLGNVVNLDQIKLPLAQRELLAKNGFVVVDPKDSQYQEFYQVYESIRYSEDMTPFVTTDSVYHIYHLLFDKILRDLEREKFIPMLASITTDLFEASLAQWQELKSTGLEEAALRNVAFFAVAGKLQELKLNAPPEAQPWVDAELKLINAHQGASTSPLWDHPDLPDDQKLIEDYSQYIPRGHYTRSPELGKYFKAMMWFGRMTLRLRDVQETQRALLLVQAMRAMPESQKNWEAIYQATAFLVGKADDLSFAEYGNLSDGIFGEKPDLKNFNDQALLERFKQAVKKLPPPQVNSMWVWIWEDRDDATQGFRVMGQRFTLDAYVFGQVMWRKVGTIDKPRDLPKAMDLLAAMGSTEAHDILKEMGENQYKNYDKQMEKVKHEVASLGKESWTQNVYWSWLYSFFPLIEPKSEAYPAFMRTQAWNRKELATALGSYTELKHDTILYAKQVMAEMGGGLLEDPPRSYVEPNPLAYARLEALAQMTMDGLKQSGLAIDSAQYNLENLIDLLQFLRKIAEKELNGEKITADEYTRLLTYGGELEVLTLAAADTNDPSERDLRDKKAALVADIATGMDRVLEEAIGRPALIYVVNPQDPTRITLGAVFSYYEFEVKPGDRMTDETWQAKVETGDIPAMPAWTEMFVAK